MTIEITLYMTMWILSITAVIGFISWAVTTIRKIEYITGITSIVCSLALVPVCITYDHNKTQAAWNVRIVLAEQELEANLSGPWLPLYDKINEDEYNRDTVGLIITHNLKLRPYPKLSIKGFDLFVQSGGWRIDDLLKDYVGADSLDAGNGK